MTTRMVRFRRLCTVTLLLSAGCQTTRPVPPPPPLNAALVQVESDAFVDRIDAIAVHPTFRTEPFELAAGRHTLRLRRRVSVWSAPLTVPVGYSMVLGSDQLRSTAYGSDAFCSLTFEARAGVGYVARTEMKTGEAEWIGSVSGLGVEESCRAAEPVRRELVGQVRYLCCNMWFNYRDASDANYRYEGHGSTARLAAGTRVRLTDAGPNWIAFVVEDDGLTYSISFDFGRGRTEALSYFDGIFRTDDPRAELAGATEPIRKAVAAGRLVPGMTKDQAVLARGYPPRHQTPYLDDGAWLYYDGPGRGQRVVFSDGIIQSVDDVDAP